MSVYAKLLLFLIVCATLLSTVISYLSANPVTLGLAIVLGFVCTLIIFHSRKTF